MKIVLFVCTVLFSSFLLLSCKKDSITPPEVQPKLKLEILDASCTEVWIKLSTENITLPADVELLKDSIPVETIILAAADTILYVDSLLPGHSYNFRAIAETYNSINFQVNTLNASSNNFTINEWKFGEYGNSVLNDVVVLDENNIWAVGEIYMLDSLGQQDGPYNLIHWNGSIWEIKRVFFPNHTPYPAKAISVFDDGQIWISSSGDKIAILKDDVQINQFYIPWSFSINKIWGQSSNDIYVAGNGGNIVHYQNGQWSKMESGTDVDLNSIAGSYNRNDIWISGFNTTGSHHSILLRVNNSDVFKEWESQNLVETEPYGLNIYSVFELGNLLFAASNEGVFRKDLLLSSPVKRIIADPTRKNGISGNALNNIFTAGNNSLILHYDGISWQSIYSNYQKTSVLYSINTKNKITASVGTIVQDVVYHQAQIIIIKQNQ